MNLERASVCPLDCPDTCSLTVTVEQDRIVGIRGSRANPYTERRALRQGAASCIPGFVHGPGRLTTPLRRVGRQGEGRFERTTWDEALDIIHERFTAIIATHGPQAILPLNYAGPHGFLAGGSMDLRFFHRLGATPARSQAALRRHPHRGLDGHLRPGAGHPARAGRARQARSSPGATTSPGRTCT